MTNSAIEKSERLSNSRLQRLSSKIHKFGMRHNLPRIHGCVWDRHCRWCGAPRRIDLMWGRHSVWVDLPGYDKAMTWSRHTGGGETTEPEHIPASWQLLPLFGHYRRPASPI